MTYRIAAKASANAINTSAKFTVHSVRIVAFW